MTTRRHKCAGCGKVKRITWTRRTLTERGVEIEHRCPRCIPPDEGRNIALSLLGKNFSSDDG